mgnify:CR=1 FL=1
MRYNLRVMNDFKNNFVRAEFHCHTIYSPDSLVKVKDLLMACEKKGITKIAITDHGSMGGAFEAKALAPERIVLAEEIETTEGELLAYFMTEAIPQGLEVMEVIERLKDQGAYISVAHPFDPYRGNQWFPETLEAIAPHLDGVEAFNARCWKQSFNDLAYAYAMKHELQILVGSDSHSLHELGTATLTMPDFNSADELREALKQAEFSGELSGAWVRVLSTYAKFAKKLF